MMHTQASSYICISIYVEGPKRIYSNQDMPCATVAAAIVTAAIPILNIVEERGLVELAQVGVVRYTILLSGVDFVNILLLRINC